MANLNEELLDFKFKKLNPNAISPKKNIGDVGWDLCCVEDDSFRYVRRGLGETPANYCMELTPGSRYGFRTGISIELPEGYHGIIKPRSGLAVKHGINVLAGVIDSSYRGELIICLHNTSIKTVTICPGDKIAQILIIKEQEGVFREVDELSSTSRGEQGFGSTGQ